MMRKSGSRLEEEPALMIRIVSNLARLGVGFLAGLLLIRLLGGRIGLDLVALWLLVGSQVGIAGIFLTLTERSLVRELGRAWHAGPAVFRPVFSTSLLLAGALALVAGFVFALLWYGIDVLDLPEGTTGLARKIVLAEATMAIVGICGSPYQALFGVRERFVLQNLVLLARRTVSLVAIVFVSVDGTAETQLAEFVTLNAWLNVGVVIFAVLAQSALEPLARPVFSKASRRALQQIMSTFGWNSVVVLFLNLNVRVVALLVNLLLGMASTVPYQFAIRLSAYARMIAEGTASGVDAVTVRIQKDTPERISAWLRKVTEIQAIATLPIGVLIFLAAPTLLQAWLGPVFEDSPGLLETTSFVTRLIVIQMIIRAVADGWIRVFYGLGLVARYAKVVALVGILQPIAIVLLTGVFGPLLALPALVLVVATAFTQLVVIPIRLERVRPGFLADIRAAVKWPLLATALAAPLLIPLWEPAGPKWLFGCGSAYVLLLVVVLGRRVKALRGPLAVEVKSRLGVN